MNSKVLVSQNSFELKNQLNALASGDFIPNLGILFTSDGKDSAEIIPLFSHNNIDLFGCSSREEIADEALYNQSIVTLLLDISRNYYNMKYFYDENDISIGKEVGVWAYESFSNPVVLLLVGGSSITINGDRLLQGIFSVCDRLPLFGGLASAVENIYETTLLDSENVYTQGVLAIVFDNDMVSLDGIAISGWLEIGTPKRITKSSGNIVYEIEGSPATAFYDKYFKIQANSFDQFLASEYPISLMREDGTKVIRTAVSMDWNKQCVYYGGNIPEGSMVRFCSPNIVETIDHTIEQLNIFKNMEKLRNTDAVILFECAIRSQSFGTYMQKEIQCIKELWDVPLVGFCSWGEIGNYQGERCDFHNTTLSMVTIQEKAPSQKLQTTTEYSSEKTVAFVENVFDDNSIEALERQVQMLRKEKSMLSNFLHLTSDDLDVANREIKKEQEKSEHLLLNILPHPIAERLKNGETTIADSFSEATILFADLVGFTKLSGTMNADALVKLLNRLFSNFDNLTFESGIEKIKTIGDAYMAVSGLPHVEEKHAEKVMDLAIGMIEIVKDFNNDNNTDLQIRIGINSGPVVGGVIGTKKFIYDLWGDAVNIASRMESHGVAGRIHVSDATYGLLKCTYSFEDRGDIEVKGKGMMKTYLLVEKSTS